MKNKSIGKITSVIFKAVGLAMGVAVLVLSILDKLEVSSSITMLSIGVTCIGISLLSDNTKA